MPGTENSESNADKDAQKQLWDDKKVQMGQGRAAECPLNAAIFVAHNDAFPSG